MAPPGLCSGLQRARVTARRIMPGGVLRRFKILTYYFICPWPGHQARLAEGFLCLNSEALIAAIVSALLNSRIVYDELRYP